MSVCMRSGNWFSKNNLSFLNIMISERRLYTKLQYLKHWKFSVGIVSEYYKIKLQLLKLYTVFQVFLTAPGQTDKMPKNGIFLSFSEMTTVSIKPTLYSTSKELRRYSANERECFFHSERQLSFFKSYSQQKCESECLANYTKIQCGCVKFSMPSKQTMMIIFSNISEE